MSLRRRDSAPTAPATPMAAAATFRIPVEILQETVQVLRAAGRDGNEAFVLWGGTVDGTICTMRSCIVPEQTALKTSHGLIVTVDGQALFEANRALFERQEILAAQVHSHPTDAYHSDTDDCYALVTMTGALSVVVPNFSRDGLDDMRGWAWYRLTGHNTWSELTRRDRVQVLHPKDN